MRIMALAAMRENIQHFVAVLDAPVVRVARDILGLPLIPLAGHAPVHPHGRTEQPGGLCPRSVVDGHCPADAIAKWDRQIRD